MRLLITAGPTREYIDPVRFITNGSTGKMGYACAEVAVKRGHQVVLVSGPVHLEKPRGTKLIQVVTSDDMAEAVLREFPKCDGVVMTAAVGDYRPAKTLDHKMQKGEENLNLKLIRTMDILKELGRQKQNQFLIGFAVQDRAARQNARRKLREKNLDAIILNNPTAMGAGKTKIGILQKGQSWDAYDSISKKQIAGKVIKLAETLFIRHSQTK